MLREGDVRSRGERKCELVARQLIRILASTGNRSLNATFSVALILHLCGGIELVSDLSDSHGGLLCSLDGIEAGIVVPWTTGCFQEACAAGYFLQLAPLSHPASATDAAGCCARAADSTPGAACRLQCSFSRQSNAASECLASLRTSENFSRHSTVFNKSDGGHSQHPSQQSYALHSFTSGWAKSMDAANS